MLVRLQQACDGCAGRGFGAAHDGAEIGAPATQIVVHVDTRNASLQSRLQVADAAGDRHRQPREARSILEVEVREHVQHQHDGPGPVGRGPVHAVMRCGHRPLAWRTRWRDERDVCPELEPESCTRKTAPSMNAVDGYACHSGGRGCTVLPPLLP